MPHAALIGHNATQFTRSVLTLAEVEINATARNTDIWEAKRLLGSGDGMNDGS